MSMLRIALASAAAIAFVAPAAAQPRSAPSAPPAPAASGAAAPKEAQPERPVPPPTVSVTHHAGLFGGQRVSYVATASETYLRADDGTPKAAIFSVSYVKEPRDPS